MANCYIRRTLTGWVPYDESSKEIWNKYKLNEVYRADIVKPRELTSLRRYWALVNMVYSNSDQFSSTECLHQYLKIRCGHCTPITNKLTGEVFLVPNSISFSTLDEVEFQKVWKSIVDIICNEILPGITDVEIEYELQKVCGLAG